MRAPLSLFLLCLTLLGSQPLRAQQLLWERANRRASADREFNTNLVLTDGNRALVSGASRPFPFSPFCSPYLRPHVQLWDITTGTLLREQLLRPNPGQFGAPVRRAGTGYWWASDAMRCDNAGATETYSLAYRLSAQGDTLRALQPVPVVPDCITSCLLVQGNRLAIAGNAPLDPTGGTNATLFLTLADTSGRLLSHHTYPRLARDLDYSSDLVRTPRGGYLLSGDGYDFATLTYQHLLLETDSLGRQLKQRLLFPLGPVFNDGRRYDHSCNIVVLPNAGGYVLSGRADSAYTPTTRRSVCYLLRLDTALNVQWVYRHPTSTNGNGVRSQYPNKVRLLPDGSLGLLVRNRQAAGTPLDLYLVQVDTQTGQHRATYPLPSPGGYGVAPYDWHWLPDNTLLLCGEAVQATSTGGKHAYLARWDFRATPLATGRPATQASGATLQLYPTPGTPAAPTTAHYQLPPGTRGATLLVTDVLGRPVQRHLLPPAPRTGSLPLAGLPAGLYLVRLLPERGPGLTQRLLVQP